MGEGTVNTNSAALRIRLLGGFRLFLGEKEIDTNAWKHRKSKNLVKILAMEAGHQLHREVLIERLWPGSPFESAMNNLYQTIYATRRALMVPSLPPQGILRFEENTLHLDPRGGLWVDAGAFEQAAAAANGSRDPAVFRAALELYTGDLLPEDLYEDWASERRASLRQEYLHLLSELGKLLEAAEDYTGAVQVYQAVLEKDPAHEETHAALMRSYALSGHRQEALRQYQVLQKALLQELDAEPGPESLHLYQEILSGRLSAPAGERRGDRETGRHGDAGTRRRGESEAVDSIEAGASASPRLRVSASPRSPISASQSPQPFERFHRA